MAWFNIRLPTIHFDSFIYYESIVCLSNDFMNNKTLPNNAFVNSQGLLWFS